MTPSISICDLLLKQIATTADLPTGVGAAAATHCHRQPQTAWGVAALDHGLAGDCRASDAGGE